MIVVRPATFHLPDPDTTEPISSMLRRWSATTATPVRHVADTVGAPPNRRLEQWTDDQLVAASHLIGVPARMLVDNQARLLVAAGHHRQRGALRPDGATAVCPNCLRERPGRFDVLWRLPASACPNHRTRLVTRCPEGHPIGADPRGTSFHATQWRQLPVAACGTATDRGTCPRDLALLPTGRSAAGDVTASYVVSRTFQHATPAACYRWWWDVVACSTLPAHDPATAIQGIRLRGPLDATTVDVAGRLRCFAPERLAAMRRTYTVSVLLADAVVVAHLLQQRAHSSLRAALRNLELPTVQPRQPRDLTTALSVAANEYARMLSRVAWLPEHER